MRMNFDCGDFCIVGNVSACRETSTNWELCSQVLTSKSVIWCLKMDLEGFIPQISKLGPATKMGLASQFLQVFHPKITKIDDNLYNDPLWIRWELMHPHQNLGVICVIQNEGMTQGFMHMHWKTHVECKNN
jgi:hypothetical protein